MRDGTHALARLRVLGIADFNERGNARASLRIEQESVKLRDIRKGRISSMTFFAWEQPAFSRAFVSVKARKRSCACRASCSERSSPDSAASSISLASLLWSDSRVSAPSGSSADMSRSLFAHVYISSLGEVTVSAVMFPTMVASIRGLPPVRSSGIGGSFGLGG